MVCGGITVIAALLQAFVPEPPAWVAAQARKAHNPNDTVDAVSGKSSALADNFSDAARRRMFLLWPLTAGSLQFGYYGVNNWMPTYLEKKLHLDFKSMTGYMVGTYVAMIPGKVLAGRLADQLGRRVVFAAGAFGTALFLPIIVFFNTPDNIAYRPHTASRVVRLLVRLTMRGVRPEHRIPSQRRHDA